MVICAYFCKIIIQYASDLHLEFPENHGYIWQHPLKPMADILVLAGDIVPFRQIADKAWFFDYLSKNFKTTYWIPGNHEYYHDDLAAKRGTFIENVRENIFLVNDYAVTIQDARLIFATLWTTVKPNHRLAVERGINDFHLIRYRGNRLSCDDLEKEHKTSLEFIEQELAQETPGIKKIVVTHHVPTFVNYPPQYFGDVLNEAFAVNLTRLNQKQGPDYWIYGHHHQNVPDFKTGKTTLVTNQMGYVRNGESELFDNGRTLTIAF